MSNLQSILISDLSYVFFSDEYPLQPEQKQEYSKMIEDSKDYKDLIFDMYNYTVLQDEELEEPLTKIVKSYKKGDIISMSKARFTLWLRKYPGRDHVQVTQKHNRISIYNPPLYDRKNIILYLIYKNIIIGYVKSKINHNCILIEYVNIKNSFTGKGLCMPLIHQFINFTKYLGKNYYLHNAAGIPSYRCYFKAFCTEYDVYTFKVDDEKKFEGKVDQNFMLKSENLVKYDVDDDVEIWMFFVKKNILASAHEGGNNKKFYHKLINYLNFSL